EDQGRAFNHRPIAQRIAVLFAGPLFNFLFAILAYWVLFMPGVMVLKPAIGAVEPGSYADRAGLEFGDKITAVDGQEVNDWETALVAILDTMVATGSVPLSIEDQRGSQRRATIEVGSDATRLTEPGVLFDGLGFEVWQPPAVIGGLTAGKAAERAGLAPGDRITAIDDQPVQSWNDLLAIVQSRPGEAVEVDYVRDGATASVDLVLGEDGTGDDRRGVIGIELANTWEDYYFLRTYSPVESLSAAVDKTWTSTLFTVRMLARMVTGDVSIKNISGPINIAQFAGESAERGFSYFLGFLAIISISLGVLNLLPIPVLDGGQIVYQLAELVKGSPLTERAQILGQQIGILALLLLMSFAFYNDIARILG
ncbi:MAG: RIP metalloprotease RseP, partial [Woeseiaceae bacterium]